MPWRGQPSDVTAAVTFLAGPDAGFITGQSLHVDGGWIRHRPARLREDAHMERVRAIRRSNRP
ncbi:SDR family oxidoreductase [Nonomuraea insulae]|uniref:SDR family oxidoreductase n=1 Tax=Nonomuraea insulae TaxID=1616787 RepID=A0ABW1D1T5_9ACTN